MVKLIWALLIIFFLLFSFSPTILDLRNENKLTDSRREYVLEHNYYWPDYNLYLSKIFQGSEGHILAVERYTSEPHKGSLIQVLYTFLGFIGKIASLSPNQSYLMGRIIFSITLLLTLVLLIKKIVKGNIWQISTFIMVVVSGSFIKVSQNELGHTMFGRFMDFWSNMDALQRLTHLPHILAAQTITFILLLSFFKTRKGDKEKKSTARCVTETVLITILGNILGLIFPPSLMTLDGILLVHFIFEFIKNRFNFGNWKLEIGNLLFILLTLPSLLYIFFLTKSVPWSSLVDAHKMTRMPVALDQFVLATGPIFYLSFLGIVTAVIKRKKNLYPLIYFVAVTYLFAAYFSFVDDQSPLRFTQTGLFIPYGILGAYFIKELYEWLKTIINSAHVILLKSVLFLITIFYFLYSLFVMKLSFDWQYHYLSEWAGATRPDVPYPPQAVPPLTTFMDGIRYLGLNTNHNDVVIADISAANYIPAYAGNSVWWGQTNTYDYFRKKSLMESFFNGELSNTQSQYLMNEGNIKYVFVGPQEKERLKEKDIVSLYPFLKSVYKNRDVEIFRVTK